MSDFVVSLSKQEDGRIQLRFRHPITGKRRRLLYESFELAREAKKDFEQKYGTKTVSEFIDCSIGELVEIHLNRCPQSRLLERKNAFRDFFQTFQKAKASEITKEHLIEWFLLFQKKKQLSNRTMSSIKAQLNHFFKFLVEIKVISESPLDRYRIKRETKPRKARVVLSENEIITILAETKRFKNSSLFPILYTFVHTGARREEVLSLEWKNIDLENSLIHFLKTKNGEARTIHMSPKLKDLFKSLKGRGEFVHTNPRTNTRFSRTSLQRLLDAFKKEFPQSKKWGCHAFRHSFAYAYLRCGGNMYELQAILGHKSIHMTIDLYGQLKARDVAKPSPFDF